MMLYACAISSRTFKHKIIIIDLFTLNFISEFQNCRYLSNFCKNFFDTFVATLPLTSMEKWYFQNVMKILTVVLYTSPKLYFELNNTYKALDITQ